jgi:hypothetical protein
VNDILFGFIDVVFWGILLSIIIGGIASLSPPVGVTGFAQL